MMIVRAWQMAQNIKLLPQREFYMIHSTLVALFTHRVLNVEGDPRPRRGRFTKIWEIFHITHPGT